MPEQTKVFIITGGARGIGYAFAEKLAHAGHRLVIADIGGAYEAAERIRSAGYAAIGLTIDVTKGHLEKPLRVWQNVGASNLT
ncbi:SDR family NAD(P)-dependent oxidoreductase [Noviherbaspirillum suwonense]|uniref:Short chain dehydrogenase n=1 Tax=Noviherbaspirillum suwonense TaxID=1224511 RepID=A0ABY1QRK4_9BURK|nr:SDR family NAD(P)-dependent oxidoreductase [Noviherbaspirillum suwonense]SMP78903.1 short chain dehydrogenase [Noviherbaspirillum suwonense]